MRVIERRGQKWRLRGREAWAKAVGMERGMGFGRGREPRMESLRQWVRVVGKEEGRDEDSVEVSTSSWG